MGEALVGLQDWQRQYAAWLSVQEKKPTQTVKRAKVAFFAGQSIGEAQLQDLEQSSLFRDLCRDLGESQILKARKRLEQSSDQFAQDYLAMAEMAKQAGDYDKWHKYGMPLLDRIWVKRDEGQPKGLTINVSFGKEGFAAKTQEVTEADFEVIATVEDA